MSGKYKLDSSDQESTGNEDYDQEDMSVLNHEENEDIVESDETPVANTRRRSSRVKDQSKKRKKSSSVAATSVAAAVAKSTKKSVSSSKLTTHKTTSKTKSSRAKKSSASDSNLLDQLKTVIMDLFGYEFNDFDINFLTQIFTQLPRLNEVWTEIGFDQQTKQARLDEFYKTVFDTVDDMISNELELKEQIETSIEKQKKQINEICYELQRGFEELKSLKTLESLPMLEKDDLLRKELKRLQAEKQKRLDEHKKLTDQEDELCEKLNEPRLIIKKASSSSRHTVPSEAELSALSAHIIDLNKILDDRRRKMITLQNDIVTLNSELDMSKSDSFAELIVFESIDKLPTLSISDLQRAEELRDDLSRRNIEIVGQIKEVRSKIKDLWTKLNCENSEDKMLQSMVYSESTQGSDFGSLTKRELLYELSMEFERCYAIKMENMQRFTEAIRSEIRILCDKMFMMGDEDGLGVILNDQNYNNEELLEAHEEKLEQLRFVYAESADLFDRVSEWSKVWKDYCDFEKKTQDPQRFKERGYSMLEEERQRKTFKNMLPKLEEEIVRLAGDYETNNNRPFCIHGEPYRQFIENKKTLYEESKLMERKEKQIMRDTLKKTESKFGSKPITPLALKNKRGKMGCVNASSMAASESHLQTPSRLTSLRSSNLSKLATPTNGGNQSRVGGPSKSILHQVQSKSKAIKRKSRTPGKNSQQQRRRSKLIIEQLAQESAMAGENETTLCSTNTMTSGAGNGVSTSKLSGYSSSGYSIASKSNTSSVSSVSGSNKYGYQKTTTATATVKTTTTTTTGKNPPLSASAKYSHFGATLERMTSTASNTLIEDEHCDLNEITQYAANKCVEQAAYKLNCDVNYLEFSRNLSKPISKAPLGDSTNSGGGSTRSGLVRIRK